MINNARGSHSSPGAYTKETDVTYSVKSLGITSLGLAGEALKGPAFEPISVKKWSEFEDIFGSTSTEKYKGTGYPKYEMPYIAKEYLKESNQLVICRTLGLSGYNAGKAWTITAMKDDKKYALVVLRSKAEYNASSKEGCESGSGDILKFAVSSITIQPYTEVIYDGDCQAITATTSETGYVISETNYGKFTLKVVDINGKEYFYPVSLNYSDKDYIFNVLGSNPLEGSAPIFVEEFYDYALASLAKKVTGYTITSGNISAYEGLSCYKDHFQCASTPWIVSELHTDSEKANVNKLFRFFTISDGNVANSEVKISIQNIRPDAGTFDVIVRTFSDTDNSPRILEKFSGCNMVEGDSNYIALRIGTMDGSYELKSKYIGLEMAEEKHPTSVPCGFMGFPLHKFESGVNNLDVAYNTHYDESIKAKRQYFGMSNITGVDVDILKYKGALSEMTIDSKGFHLDSLLSIENTASTLSGECYIDNVKYAFDAVSPLTEGKAKRVPRILTEDYMKDTLYSDVNTRKFTVHTYGGFDGWDIYREQRTNTDNFKSTTYKGQVDVTITGSASFTYSVPGYLNLPNGAISSDYYAYLGAYNQFLNPEEVDINIFATPGIDAFNNSLLVEDVFDVIEDPDDGRNGDALYIFTTPNRPSGNTDSVDEMYTAQEVVDGLDNTSIDSSYGCTYWPWVKCFDSNENMYINLPVTKDVVRNMAYTDNVSHPWFSAAGINRGGVDCVKACMKTKVGDEDVLYDGRINPVKTFAVDGVKIWGNKTVYSVDSPLNRINVRRLMIRVKKLVVSASRQLIFEQYDTSLKNQFLSLVNPILAEVKANRGISDYKIDIDDSAEARDAHTLPAVIHIKPTPSLEYIDLTFTVYPESVEFN